MNREQLQVERQAAGQAYAEAAEAFREAWARLAAIDRTQSNSNVAQGEAIRSWHFASRNKLEDGLRALQHLEFAPRLIVNDWHDRAVAISDKQISEFTP
ncbi:hypothetical protein [Bradyrhizobium iriomotense]|uniref:Uncharacterized protein n=1 Tax=Bradyrhizobium iriomotense TaxID=441950 RepID=A0ABQ6BEE4_9BRAD|nr:hypothetical protein [Bradyrhizobium iriomotense]GLR91315.1 hypothetical protein GCM10007857_80320 [Bradyrhizobium iriomotense]